MALKFEAHVSFEVPEGTKPDELAEVLSYIKEAVDKWRYMRPKRRGAEPGPWKMSNIDVPSFSVEDSRAHHSGQRLSTVSLHAEVAAVDVRVDRPIEAASVKNKVRVIVQRWEESERGWGVHPDGFSIHPSEDALFRYVDNYRKYLPDEIPDEYERPCGAPYFAEVELDRGEDIGDGKRFYRHQESDYPGDVGHDGDHDDGWVNR